MSSALLAVEAVRACLRYGPAYARTANEGVRDVGLIAIGDAVLQAAARLEPPALRSLDAVHLATAMAMHDRGHLGVFLAYDERLLDAAGRHGLPVAQPA